MTVLETALAGLAIGVAVLGLALLPVLSRPVVAGLVRAMDASAETGLGERRTLDMAEAVRRFVTDPGAPALPDAVDGREGFDAESVSHLEDVRDVIVPAVRLSVGLAAGAGVWAALRRRTPAGRRAVGRAMWCAGWGLMAVAALALVAGATDFDTLFDRFHGLFFAAGTWVFPAEALLVQVFPLPFWVWAGALWGGLALTGAVALVVLGSPSRFTEHEYGV